MGLPLREVDATQPTNETHVFFRMQAKSPIPAITGYPPGRSPPAMQRLAGGGPVDNPSTSITTTTTL